MVNVSEEGRRLPYQASYRLGCRLPAKPETTAKKAQVLPCVKFYSAGAWFSDSIQVLA